MPTYQLTITTGSTTTQATLTYSGPDATRIFNAYKANWLKPNATQQDFTNDMVTQAKTQFQSMCVSNETVPPVPPDITVS